MFLIVFISYKIIPMAFLCCRLADSLVYISCVSLQTGRRIYLCCFSFLQQDTLVLLHRTHRRSLRVLRFVTFYYNVLFLKKILSIELFKFHTTSPQRKIVPAKKVQQSKLSQLMICIEWSKIILPSPTTRCNVPIYSSQRWSQPQSHMEAATPSHGTSGLQCSSRVTAVHPFQLRKYNGKPTMAPSSCLLAVARAASPSLPSRASLLRSQRHRPQAVSRRWRRSLHFCRATPSSSPPPPEDAADYEVGTCLSASFFLTSFTATSVDCCAKLLHSAHLVDFDWYNRSAVCLRLNFFS
jgi:hypothetical protein